MLARPQAPKGAGPRQTWARPRQYGQLCAEQVEVRYGRTQPPGARCSAQASQRREEGRRALPGSPRTRERRGHTRQQPAAAARLVKWRSHRRFELKRGKSLGCGMSKKTFCKKSASAYPRSSWNSWELTSAVKAPFLTCFVSSWCVCRCGGRLGATGSRHNVRRLVTTRARARRAPLT